MVVKRLLVITFVLVMIISPATGEGTTLFFVGNFGTEYSLSADYSLNQTSNLHIINIDYQLTARLNNSIGVFDIFAEFSVKMGDLILNSVIQPLGPLLPFGNSEEKTVSLPFHLDKEAKVSVFVSLRMNETFLSGDQEYPLIVLDNFLFDISIGGPFGLTTELQPVPQDPIIDWGNIMLLALLTIAGFFTIRWILVTTFRPKDSTPRLTGDTDPIEVSESKLSLSEYRQALRESMERRVEKLRPCPSCGVQLSYDDRFCYSCGINVEIIA